MNVDDRLKFMRDWVKYVNDTYPEENQKKIECLNWAIKQCQKTLDRNRSKKSYYIWE